MLKEVPAEIPAGSCWSFLLDPTAHPRKFIVRMSNSSCPVPQLGSAGQDLPGAFSRGRGHMGGSEGQGGTWGALRGRRHMGGSEGSCCRRSVGQETNLNCLSPKMGLKVAFRTGGV